jgi:hypothetical protein
LLDSNRSALSTIYSSPFLHLLPSTASLALLSLFPKTAGIKSKQSKHPQPSSHVDSFGFSRYENEDIYTPTRNKMIAALHKRTEIGREVIDEEALRACPVKEVCHYIERNF